MFKSDPTLGFFRVPTPAATLGVFALTLLVSCGPPAGRVYVAVGPPPERVEVIDVAPSPGFVWVRGYWRYDGYGYVWMPGRWVAVDRRYREWVPGHWKRDRRGWYWVEGRWR
jgi:hypothetical protein